MHQISNLQYESRILLFIIIINFYLCKLLVHTVSKKQVFHCVCVCVFELTGWCLVDFVNFSSALH